MYQLSDNVQRIQESATMAITARANAMKQAGEDVIAMAAGEPDFDTPTPIAAAAKAAIDGGHTRYTPASGTPELRAAWAELIGRQRGVTYTPNQIIVTAGGKQAVWNVIYTLVNPGDEVIIPAPYWVSYPEQVRSVDGRPIIIEAGVDQDFKITPQQLRDAITPRTRLFILNSPSNPTGAVYSRDELAALAEVLVDKGVPVMSDEVYDALVYGVPFSSIASLGEDIYRLTIIIAAMSKTFAMTGWRVGCAVGPADIIAAAGRIQSHSTSNVNSVAQQAALAALQGDRSSVDVMRREFDRRRQYMVRRLGAIPGVVCPEPQGAFYAFPEVSSAYGRTFRGEVIDGSMSYCRLLLEHEKVAAVPGCGFGADAHIRLSYATGMAQIEAALDRIEWFMRHLR
jgi:aspartate aminotransferase